MDLMERIMELTDQGYCCAQILAILLLDTLGEEDPGFVRAMGGLQYGVGYSYGCCGCMTGGAAILSYRIGLGYGEDAPDVQEYDKELHREALTDFAQWFEQEMGENFGGIDCRTIIQGSMARCIEVCPGIIASTYEKCMEILEERELL